MHSDGKLTYLMNVSLDGFVATPDGGLEWSLVDDELHGWFNDRTRASQAALYGRRMYDLMSAYWPTAEDDPSATDVTREYARIWNSQPKIVFSRSLDGVGPNARLVRGDVRDVLAGVRREFHGNLEVSGPGLAGQFVRHGLVDEYQLVVHPVVLGSGIPFWPALEEPLRLRSVETREFKSGVVLRSFVPEQQASH